MTNSLLSSTITAGSSTRPSVIALSIKERSGLYSAYMPFLKNGGIFVPTNRAYPMGESVFILLQLMDDPIKYSIEGKVAWVNPSNSQQNRLPGIGLHFTADDNARALKLRIEEILGSALRVSKPTHTL